MKTFYSAFTCQGNTGDLLINKYQIEEYAKYGPVYVDCTGMPDTFKSTIFDGKNPNVKDFVVEYGVPYRGVKMFSIIRRLKCDGFTHFTKSPGPYAVIDLPVKRLLIRLIGAAGFYYAHKLGMKVFALGIDLSFPTNKILAAVNSKYFSLYDKIGLRSKQNYDGLKEHGESFLYCPDMAFLCPNNFLEAGSKKRIAISFRKVDDMERLLSILEVVCSNLTSLGYQVEFVYQVEEDRQFQELLVKRLSGYNPNFVDALIDFDHLKNYSKYDLVISNRLHVLLMGCMHGAVPIGIISKDRKEQKIMNLFSTVFSGKYCYYIDEFCLENLTFLFSDLKEARNSIFKDLSEQKNLVKSIVQNIYKG